MRQMKDSGIAWIGQIPQNLEVIKNHYLITCVKGKNPNDLNNEGIGFPYIGASDLDSNNYSIYTTDSSLPSVDSNDVLILWDGARAGLVGIGKTGKLSSTVVKLKFTKKINSRYFYWYLLGMNSFIISCVNGTTIPHMSRKYIDDICFITFSLPEQQAIADKLDKVCGEIDKVIAKTKAAVEEYKKLKQAIITEAVTGKKQCVMRNAQCAMRN